ncbi:MAG: AAA family ATPase [Geobacter sp.]|nr:AAA family ATPase [Geobacter sp.]
MSAQHIAFYGKGGVGKSTIATNVAAALAEKGIRVLLIGCGPRDDSTTLLTGENKRPSVLELLREGRKVRAGDVTLEGFNGVRCIELGDIYQSGDCAGEGIAAALSALTDGGVFAEVDPHVVFYDVPGEIVCGGLALPMKNSLVRKTYVVSSPDLVSLYAVNNIFRTISRFGREGGARLGGIIANGLTSSFAESYITDFAGKTGSGVISFIPRSLITLQSELYGKTVIEVAPNSNQAYIYRRLAGLIIENDNTTIPTPLDQPELRSWARQWGDRIFELETGVIREGAAI